MILSFMYFTYFPVPENRMQGKKSRQMQKLKLCTGAVVVDIVVMNDCLQMIYILQMYEC